MIDRKVFLVLLTALSLVTCSANRDEHGDDHDHGHADQPAEAAAKGPHGGRLLLGKTFDLELQIVEDGVEPQYRAYLTSRGKALPATGATARVELERLGGRLQTVDLKPESDYLTSDDTVYEPHSFVVKVTAQANNATEQWSFESIEGRTTIAAAFADRAGINVAAVGPGRIREQLRLHGSLELAPGARAEVRARFPGLITSARGTVGASVRRGETLATVESNESLTRYAVTAPIGGMVAARAASAGEQTGDRVLYEIIDPNRLEAHLQVFPSDLTRVRPGQPVELRLTADGEPIVSRLTAAAPRANDRSQSVEVRAAMPPNLGLLRAGLAVTGDVLIAERTAPLVVAVEALQRWRDMDVVFRRVGDVYEVQPVELGRRDGQWAEVLGGIEAGAQYVVAQSFLIKADIEKSGAAHDH